jgi:hypothetical protein
MASSVSSRIPQFLKEVGSFSAQFDHDAGISDYEILIQRIDQAAGYAQLGKDLLTSGCDRSSGEAINIAIATVSSIQNAFVQRITELVSGGAGAPSKAARVISPLESTALARHIPAASAASNAIGIVPVSHAHPRVFSKIPRRIPPLSPLDTLIGGASAHGTATVFQDSEIKLIHGVVRHQSLGGNGVIADFTKRDKAIIQQQATRGCTAAVTAMLIMDNGRAPNLMELISRNLGDDEVMFRDLRNAGLSPATAPFRNLEELKSKLESCGSLICSMIFPCGAHVIVVDEVSDDFSIVRVRDPYHGWEISVRADAFKKYACLDSGSVHQGIYVEEGRPR